MTHEHFKSADDVMELNEFLNSGHITPKSISVTNNIVIIGYAKSKSEQKYSVEQENIVLTNYPDLSELDSALEEAAKKHNGVVCQHVELLNEHPQDSSIVEVLTPTKKVKVFFLVAQ